jgi:hypothetical protein
LSMPAIKELDLTKVPVGYVDAKRAAEMIGCREKFLANRRWVRRHGLPALQLLRGWPIFYEEKKLREWCVKRKRNVKPEHRRDARSKSARRKNGATPATGA